ncbi:hypothetical protein BN1723_017359, partial [Verticillium longisporum]|jgi:hypothetical protein
LLLA